MKVKLVSFNRNPVTDTIKKVFLIQTNTLPVRVTLTNFPEVGERNFFRKLQELDIQVDENNFLEFDVSNDIYNHIHVDIPMNPKSGQLYNLLNNINKLEYKNIQLYRIKGQKFQYLDKKYEYQNCIIDGNKYKVYINFFKLINSVFIQNKSIYMNLNKASLLWVHDQIVQKMIDFDKNNLQLIDNVGDYKNGYDKYYKKEVYLGTDDCWQVPKNNRAVMVLTQLAGGWQISENSKAVFILNQSAQSLSFDELFDYFEKITNHINDAVVMNLLIQAIALFQCKSIDINSLKMENLNNKKYQIKMYDDVELNYQFMGIFDYCTSKNMIALKNKLSQNGENNQYYSVTVGEYDVLLKYTPAQPHSHIFEVVSFCNNDLHYHEMCVYYGKKTKIAPLPKDYNALNIDLITNFPDIYQKLNKAKRNKITVPNIYGQKVLFKVKQGIAKAMGVLV